MCGPMPAIWDDLRADRWGHKSAVSGSMGISPPEMEDFVTAESGCRSWILILNYFTAGLELPTPGKLEGG